jgi:hypothetical protein
MKLTSNPTTFRFATLTGVAASLLIAGAGCSQGTELDDLEGAEQPVLVDDFAGGREAKADGAAATQNWQVYEQGGNDGLVARDQVGDVLFNAQVAQVEGASVTVDFLAPAACSVQLNAQTGELQATDCSEQSVNQIGSAIQGLYDDATQAGVLQQQAQQGKGDGGFMTKTACVVGGIGVAGVGVLAVMAAGMASAPVGIVASYGWGPVAGWLGGLGATAALCYEAFTGEDRADLTECVSDCDGTGSCIGGCISEASTALDGLSTADEATERTALLSQCMRGCEDADNVCSQLCVSSLAPTQ